MQPRVGIGIIVIKEGRFLIGKRKNAHGEGLWAFPGGHLEYLETPEACAKRELMEETGLIAKAIRRSHWTNDFIDEKHYITLFMHVTDFSGALVNKEFHKCEQWEWRKISELPSPLFHSIESLFKRHPIEQEYSYLACPYAHSDRAVMEKRVQAATETAYTFFQRGISIFSPLTHNSPLVNMGIGNGWEGKWEGFDLGMLGRAQKLYILTLPGWEDSRGVAEEIAYARKLSIPIEYISYPQESKS